MKITGPQVGPVNPIQAAKPKKVAPTAAPETTLPTDSVVLSSDVSTVEAARTIIAGTPDVRAEKVEALRQAIADGTYRAPAEKVAEKILIEGSRTRLSRK